jgi:F-type H+-transporting ATPase subunit epsilon
MAEGKLLLEIVTPQGLVFSSEVDEVTASGSEGEFGVLPGHVPFITTLKIGLKSGLTRSLSLLTARKNQMR